MKRLSAVPVLFFTVVLHVQAIAHGPGINSSSEKGSAQVAHTTEIYKTIDTCRLTIDIFTPAGPKLAGGRTAMIFFHGGGWAFGAPSEFFTTCERYAAKDAVTFSAGYRLSVLNGVTPHPLISPIECVMDARSAVRWVRENAARFNIDPAKIVVAGQSAGGHLALATAMIDGYNESTDDLSISCRPDAVLLFSACVNTLEGWCDRLLAQRRTSIWSISPMHHVKGGLPPMIEFHGTWDDQVPVWTVQFFQMDMEKAGNYFERHEYKGRRHYLGEGSPLYSGYYDEDILKTADLFLEKFGFLK